MELSVSHTALVKIQGPFTDRQLESIAEGMVYLKKLGLVSIIVMDNEHWMEEEQKIMSLSPEEKRMRIVRLRERMKAETLKFADLLEKKGGEARPLLEGVLSVSGAQFEDSWTPIASTSAKPYDGAPTSDLFVDSLSGIRDAIRRGEIPVIPPVALDAACFSLCVSANDAVRAISSGLVDHERRAGLRYESDAAIRHDVDLTPVRIMVINREGGIPSPARGGNPHLSINLESEFDHIHSTFTWNETHPTSLANLSLIRSCLVDLPRTASAVLVSHRSPRSLIANLITNKPAHSPSLHQSLLPPENLQHQPTIIRRGHHIRVSRSMADIDRDALTRLLEASFGRKLDAGPFYERLERDLDFCIVAGDYQGVAIVTNETRLEPSSSAKSIAYLDKFAVLPSLQGDGTVDFLWGALRDESFGLGLPSALNPNIGGLHGKGEGRDLVWRSRSNNPVNKWYFERSNGFFKIPPPKGSAVGFALFWCEKEDKVNAFRKEGDEGEAPKMLEEWSEVVGRIPSCWL
ncbi:amino-acid N-acetyltransferase, partial [Phenoliferia sp. Uapishka_3]